MGIFKRRLRKHAHWIKVTPAFSEEYYICSGCRNKTAQASPLCPHCGAKMGGRLRRRFVYKGILK